jgi:hypothetical protein
VELGVSLDLRVLTALGISGVAIIPAVPLRIHLGKRVRFDMSAVLNVTRATSTPSPSSLVMANGASSSASAVRLQVPVSGLYNITEAIHVGVTTGLTIDDFSNVRNTTGIPVGLFAGYAIAGKLGPIGDIDPFFTFPYLISPGVNPVTNTGEYLVGLTLNGYIYY